MPLVVGEYGGGPGAQPKRRVPIPREAKPRRLWRAASGRASEGAASCRHSIRPRPAARDLRSRQPWDSCWWRPHDGGAAVPAFSRHAAPPGSLTRTTVLDHRLIPARDIRIPPRTHPLGHIWYTGQHRPHLRRQPAERPQPVRHRRVSPVRQRDHARLPSGPRLVETVPGHHQDQGQRPTTRP